MCIQPTAAQHGFAQRLGVEWRARRPRPLPRRPNVICGGGRGLSRHEVILMRTNLIFLSFPYSSPSLLPSFCREPLRHDHFSPAAIHRRCAAAPPTTWLTFMFSVCGGLSLIILGSARRAKPVIFMKIRNSNAIQKVLPERNFLLHTNLRSGDLARALLSRGRGRGRGRPRASVFLNFFLLVCTRKYCKAVSRPRQCANIG